MDSRVVVSPSMAQSDTVSEEFKKGWVRHLTFFTMSEQSGADVAGSMLPTVPVDDEKMWQLRHDLAKFAYDEARHARICRQMIRYFSDGDTMEEVYDEWELEGEQNWLHRYNRVSMEGYRDYIDWLAVVPVMGDETGLHYFRSAAENSPDPLWADVAESIVQDEHMHVNLASEYIPYIVEREGEGIKERLEETLEKWVPFWYGMNGHPDSEYSQRTIDAGMVDLHTSDLHEYQKQSLRDLYEPLGIEVPELDDDEYLRQNEILDYAERVFLDE